MKIFVVGADKVGKSIAAQMLGCRLGLPVAETGDVLIEQLARVNAGREEVRYDEEELKNWLMRITGKKDIYRAQLTALGDLMTALNPRCLVDKCAESATIIVGVRRRREVIPFITRSQDVKNDIWIKVRGPQRGCCTSSVFELRPYKFDYELNNFGDFARLKKNILALASKLAPRIRFK